MDLFGLIAYVSIGSNKYGLVIVDDYSRFMWVFFVYDKSEVQGKVKTFIRRAQREFRLPIKKVRAIMVPNSTTPMLKSFLMRRASSMNSWLHIPLHKMGWLRGRTELSLTWQEQCLMSTRLRTTIGPKQSTPLIMLSTASIFTSTTRRHNMSS